MIKNLKAPLQQFYKFHRSFSTDTSSITHAPNLSNITQGSRTQFTGLVATVFGATGFTGRYLVQLLARTGIQVVIPYRGEDASFRDLKVLGELGQIIPMRYDIRNDDSIERAVSHSNIVINLVSRQYETRNFTFDDINIKAASKIAQISKNNAEKFVHVSALNASENSESQWSKTKAIGEKLVREINPNCTVIRPGLIFGDEDRLINKWSKITQFWPFIPRYNQDLKFQPLHCFDLASAILAVLELPNTNGKVYELGGNEIFTWKEFQDLIIEGTAQTDKLNIPVSLDFMKPVSQAIELLSRDPPFIKDELEYLNQDLLVNTGALTLSDLNVKPTPIQEKLIRLSRMYRPGKFFNAIANPQNK
ncbi:NADH dehydrogenase [ubiquinone] 1 alpha subcomplex subunit 9 [Tieghemostelium lacteum]|uniref:NADH dehydrogenase [ubiquinone] 1 alpha subcomplex subunit 9 n=1 Tax=Tieghemostelium lacteum TaxID=361077 RepID=A0A152A4X1_TIELA|nr:NADH dehydrogenase [ubiquinone] 1 alpha subcomplex subunit 9 [Tieghemostelium lacteum]|eukprot:KYR01264.1 NADH dehydrogenase [ubiquinone] 1 alpha subcomplex subunit 9 [Tieghemostelium lacteum]